MYSFVLKISSLFKGSRALEKAKISKCFDNCKGTETSRSIEMKTKDGRFIELLLWQPVKLHTEINDYIHETNDTLLFFKGLAFNHTTGDTLTSASEYYACWEKLGSQIDGRFYAIKVDRIEKTVELITDPIGLMTIYVSEYGDDIYICNKLENIRNICPLNLDYRGISTMVTCGYFLNNYTQFDNTYTLDGGTVYRLDKRPFGKRIYFEKNMVIGKKYRKLNSVTFEINTSIQKILSGIFSKYENKYCALTGGSDSRLILSLLMNSDIDPKYFTRYYYESDDVRIPRNLARKYALNYEDEKIDVFSIVSEWDSFAENFVIKNDCNVSLFQYPDVLTKIFPKNKNTLLLEGTDGAIAKNWRIRLYNIFGLNWKNDFFGIIMRNSSDMVNADVKLFTKNVIDSYIVNNRKQGYAIADIWTAFHAFEMMRRWGTAQGFKYGDNIDFLMLFCSIPMLTATFETSPLDRYCLSLHYSIVSLISKELAQWPCYNIAWGKPNVFEQIKDKIVQRIIALRNLEKIKENNDNFARNEVLCKVVPKIREKIYSYQKSQFWDYTNFIDFNKNLINIEKNNCAQNIIEMVFNLYSVFLYVINHENRRLDNP